MNILYALQVLLGFGFVIAIHELGHFLAAKRVGVTCPAFSVGFPFPVWTKDGWKGYNIFRFKWRGTEYRLGWIPFGGYVTMQGQSDSPGQLEGAKEGDETDYRNKSYWQKTQVLLGGVFMNAVTAVIGFIIAFQVGVTFIEPTVGRVDPTSQAWVENQIQVGDRIIRVNDREVVDFEDVVYAGIFDGGETILVVVERPVEGGNPGETKEVEITLTLDKDPTFGISLPSIRAQHRVVIIREESDRFPADLGENRPRDGDELISVDGRPIRNVDDAMGFLAASRGPTELGFRRGFREDAREWTVTYTPRRTFFTDRSAYTAGISGNPPPYVGLIQRDGPAARADIQPNDRFVGVVQDDGTEIALNSFGDMSRIVDESEGNPLTFVIEREGERIRKEVTPDPRESSPGRYQLGITISPFPTAGLSPAEIEKKQEEFASRMVAYGVRPGSSAEQNGLRPGDHIVGASIGDREFTNPRTGKFDRIAFQSAMLHAADKEERVDIVLKVNRDGGTTDITVTADPDGPDSGAYLALATAELRSDPVRYGLVESVHQGFYHSKKVGYKIMMTLSALFTGRVKIYHLGGPVVIAKRSYSLAQWGIGTLIFFLAFISINLAIINLLPIPVLDGGQWLIVTIEAVLGKPLPPRLMGLVGTVSFLFVVGLMLFVLANDLVTVFIRGWV
jgi:regulator of sigma E protease